MRTTATICTMDLEALPPIEDRELMDMIKQDIAGLPEEDQREMMEIAGDLFTDEELKVLFAGNFTGEMEEH